MTQRTADKILGYCVLIIGTLAMYVGIYHLFGMYGVLTLVGFFTVRGTARQLRKEGHLE